MEPVGGWFIPGTGSLCPPSSPHSQFGSPLSLSPSHGCERYSTLRSHRSAPYTSPYAHRTNSPSECRPPARITPLLLRLFTRNSNKCYWTWNVLHSSSFVWVEPQSCKWSAFRRRMYGENIHTLNCHRNIRGIGSSETYRKNNKYNDAWFNVSFCLVVGYSENTSACLSMLSSHDNWSSLQIPTHSSMMPMAHNSTSGTNSRFVYFLLVYIIATSRPLKTQLMCTIYLFSIFL